MNSTETRNDRLLRPEEAAQKLGYASRFPLYDLVKAGRLPPPIKITKRCVGWRESTLDKFIAACERRGPTARVA